jgi:hypothetical protein
MGRDKWCLFSIARAGWHAACFPFLRSLFPFQEKRQSDCEANRNYEHSACAIVFKFDHGQTFIVINGSSPKRVGKKSFPRVVSLDVFQAFLSFRSWEKLA